MFTLMNHVSKGLFACFKTSARIGFASRRTRHPGKLFTSMKPAKTSAICSKLSSGWIRGVTRERSTRF